METCKNCGHSISQEHKFCPECGQKVRDKLRFKVLLGELASAFLSWDSKFFRTIVPLIIKPGHVSKEYLGGKRKSFVAPLRLYLFFSVLFFASISVLDDVGVQFGSGDVQDEANVMDPDTIRLDIGYKPFVISKDSLEQLIEEDRLEEIPEIKNEQSPLQKKIWKKMLLIAADGGSFGSYMQENISIMFFFFLPAFGLVLWVFFMGSGLDYIEHLIYGIYFHSFFFLILWLTMIASRIIGDGWPLLVGILYMLGYLTVGVKRFYGVKTGIAVVKSVFLSLVYFITFVIFVLITLTISVFMF